MVKNILIIADLGAAGNLIKNLLWLSSEVDWPIPKDKKTTILNQYTADTSFAQWLHKESQLRVWKHYYGIDLSYDLDYTTFNKHFIKKDLPVVFLNHSAFYQLNKVNEFNDNFTTLYIRPATNFGLEWQVRSYCEKKSVEQLHNFSFNNSPDQERDEFIRINGPGAYYRVNVGNMREIIRDRQNYLDKIIQNKIDLETILSGSTDEIANALPVTVDKALIVEVISAWRSLHWPLETTLDWEYTNV